MVRNLTEFEDQLKGAKNMKQVRQLAENTPGLKDTILDSMERTKALLGTLL